MKIFLLVILFIAFIRSIPSDCGTSGTHATLEEDDTLGYSKKKNIYFLEGSAQGSRGMSTTKPTFLVIPICLPSKNVSAPACCEKCGDTVLTYQIPADIQSLPGYNGVINSCKDCTCSKLVAKLNNSTITAKYPNSYFCDGSFLKDCKAAKPDFAASQNPGNSLEFDYIEEEF
jgi:hypothetical protein